MPPRAMDAACTPKRESQYWPAKERDEEHRSSREEREMHERQPNQSTATGRARVEYGDDRDRLDRQWGGRIDGESSPKKRGPPTSPSRECITLCLCAQERSLHSRRGERVSIGLRKSERRGRGTGR